MTAPGLRCSIGRTTTRSTPAETMNPSTIAHPIDSQTGRPVRVSVDTKNAPIVPISPWAKLSCPVERNTTTRASASSA